MFALQAHHSSCSQQGPTWPCLLSSPTATATQQHQATASRHSPASVMACEHTTPIHSPPSTPSWLDLTPSFRLSFSLCVPHQLPMVFYSQQGPQASNSPLLFWVFLFSFFKLLCVLLHEIHLTALKDFYLHCLKRNWTTCLLVCFSHSIFMTTSLEFFLCFMFVSCFFFFF